MARQVKVKKYLILVDYNINGDCDYTDFIVWDYSKEQAIIKVRKQLLFNPFIDITCYKLSVSTLIAHLFNKAPKSPVCIKL